MLQLTILLNEKICSNYLSSCCIILTHYPNGPPSFLSPPSVEVSLPISLFALPLSVSVSPCLSVYLFPPPPQLCLSGSDLKTNCGEKPFLQLAVMGVCVVHVCVCLCVAVGALFIFCIST